jgi:hypothetical protein
MADTTYSAMLNQLLKAFLLFDTGDERNPGISTGNYEERLSTPINLHHGYHRLRHRHISDTALIPTQYYF